MNDKTEAQPEAPGFAADGKTPLHSIAGVGILVSAAEFNRLHAENEHMRTTLVFVERWAVHHGTKPIFTAEQALGIIQHYPRIRAITKSYVDGKRPETFDPYARIDNLEAELVKEAARTAAEKLRADQMTEQHRMQAAMNIDAREQLSARQAVPDGWRLVPTEPTSQMLHVGRYGGDKDTPAYGEKPIEGETAWPYVADHTAEKIYRAMLSAAPPPPEREPLTDEQIIQWWASENGLEDCDMAVREDFVSVVRAVQAKLCSRHGIGATNDKP